MIRTVLRLQEASVSVVIPEEEVDFKNYGSFDSALVQSPTVNYIKCILNLQHLFIYILWQNYYILHTN